MTTYLEHLDLSEWLSEALGMAPSGRHASLSGICWIVVGGESGSKARPCHQDWIRSIVQQCQIAKVPVFVKQLGTHSLVSQPYILASLKDFKGGNLDEFPDDLKVRQFPTVDVIE